MPDLWKNINNLIYTFFGVPKREEIIDIGSRETKKVIRECYDKCDKLNKVGKKLWNERNSKQFKEEIDI